ncbi:FkbM family methyltransferase [Gelidibacter algens]|uniref:FkbM family methyltransferase n=1 Tax=Gelidibacter algens TaxID=49280 RepID=A0A1A7QMF5_9FLAO|nr:FkbM family methyltransferase [Gelidibacter algens]OBX21230.1 hypothetical protein A9996_18355 [Gelidibacter algens]OBX25968.1 hypothetical protein A9996_07575 [Gelidibacter algens]RAJ25229.1 FkbM family methyltransferase [Gelidibacter algens]
MEKNLAPIIVFVYNRPWHTQQTLEALMLNDLADQSTLYIYCDGFKETISEEEKQKITSVRDIVKQKKWCKEVIVIEHKTNFGLAKSVIQGVSEVIEKHESVIVLEDDIVTGTYFLTFMNEGLKLYRDEQKVFGVSGHQFPSTKKIKDTTYFLPIMSSWGYGTWFDRWKEIEFDGQKLLNIVDSKSIGPKLDFGGMTYYKMLEDQVTGINDSWAVRFYVSMYLQNGVFLYPNKSLIKNIGLDGSGVHCKKMATELQDVIKLSNELVNVDKKSVLLKPNLVKSFKHNTTNKKRMLKSKISRMVSPEIKALIKRKLNLGISKSKTELENLKLVPRYTATSATIDGYKLIIPDSASFLFMYNEIFKTKIYKFRTENETPYIIDGGANIGLASIYFKELYPNAEIIAFEPDPEIFDILKTNLSTHNFTTIKLVKKGLWNEEKILKFHAEGADGGLLESLSKSNHPTTQYVSVTSLKPYLHKTVDFLKLDIEGAETVVLKDIVNELYRVERIFIEYHSFVEQEQSLNEIIDILKHAKFRVYISSPGLSSKSPFVDITEYNGMDMQLNIYGIKQA